MRRDEIIQLSRKQHAWHRICAQKGSHHLSLELEHGLKCQFTSNRHGKGEDGFHRKKTGFGIRKPEFRSWFPYALLYMIWDCLISLNLDSFPPPCEMVLNIS